MECKCLVIELILYKKNYKNFSMSKDELAGIKVGRWEMELISVFM